MILGEVEETVTTVEIDEETFEEIIKVRMEASERAGAVGGGWGVEHCSKTCAGPGCLLLNAAGPCPSSLFAFTALQSCTEPQLPKLPSDKRPPRRAARLLLCRPTSGSCPTCLCGGMASFS